MRIENGKKKTIYLWESHLIGLMSFPNQVEDCIFESTWYSKLGLLMLKFKSYPVKIIINKFHRIL